MVLNATVNQVDAERLRLGMKATIRLDAYPDLELPGSLMGIGAMSKTSTFRAGYVGEIPVRIKIEKTDPRVIPDLTGSAEIVMQTRDDYAGGAALGGIRRRTARPYVFVQRPEGWEQEEGRPRPDQLHARSHSLRLAKGRRDRDCSVRCSRPPTSFCSGFIR